MTDQEIAQALEKLIQEDGECPPLEQIRDLLEARVIDEKGRVLIGSWNEHKKMRKSSDRNGPSEK